MSPAGRAQFVQTLADLRDDVDIASLISSADVVSFSRRSFLKDQAQGSRVIVDIKPISNVGAVAINGQRLAIKRIQHRQWDKLFRKLIGAIIIRAIRDHHRQAVSAVPRPCDVIRGGFCRRIRRAWVVWRGLGEHSGLAERTIDLIGRDMNEPKGLLAKLLVLVKIRTRGVEKRKGPNDICLNEYGRSRDRSVNMALGRKVNHSIRPVLRKDRSQADGIAYVELFKSVTGVGCDKRE